MKIVKVYENQVAILEKSGVFSDMLKEGVYFKGANTTISKYNLNEYIEINKDFELFKRNQTVNENYTLIEISDFELGICYDSKNFKEVLLPGKYLFPKKFLQYKIDIIDTRENKLNIELNKTIKNHLLNLGLIFEIKVYSNELSLFSINGEVKEILEPGSYYFWNNGLEINFGKVDIRNQQLELLGQELLTKDKANIRLNFNVTYKVTDVKKAVLNNEDYKKQLYLTIQMTIREFVGVMTLDEILEKKDFLNIEILKAIKNKQEVFGVEILNCGIKDIILPGEIKDILNKVLIAEKTAQANIIKRREETASTRSLLNTAKLMEDNKMLYNLKQLEYIETIAEKIGSISVNSNTQILGQLKQIFDPGVSNV